MATINFGNTVTLKQAAALIMATPSNRVLLLGEPGIGKSWLLNVIGKATGYDTAYIDVPNMDLGDIAMPVMNHDTKTTGYYPNSRFKLHTGKPVAIMLDEFTKGVDPVKNMLHPLLEVANPRLGDVPVHPDSIIFLTGNLANNGLGDNIKAHTLNRVTLLTVSKPTADEWLQWATNNDIEPIVMAWVKQFPHALASYLDETQGDNPYIYNPKKVQTAYVSPRSLHRVSNIIKNRARVDDDALIAAMAGTIGEAAARDMQAYIAYQDQLPTWEAIVENPKTTELPKTPGACGVLVFGAVQKVDKKSIAPFMEYVSRMSPEWQACFCINLAKNPSKQAIAFSSKAFADWVEQNEDIL